MTLPLPSTPATFRGLLTDEEAERLRGERIWAGFADAVVAHKARQARCSDFDRLAYLLDQFDTLGCAPKHTGAKGCPCKGCAAPVPPPKPLQELLK